MFTIFITHTSFQLYHAHFPSLYLKTINSPPSQSPPSQSPPLPEATAASQDNDHRAAAALLPSEQGVTLRSTRLYDFCHVRERGEWLDVLVALIEYLRSGESKVGFLNKSLEKNMLHKDVEDAADEAVVGEEIPQTGGTGRVEGGDVGSVGDGRGGLRRSRRKRGVGDRDVEEVEEGSRKIGRGRRRGM